MARYDVYRNPRKESVRLVPFLLDVQSDFLDDLDTRVIVPLRTAAGVPQPLGRLNPLFTIDGVTVVMDTPQLVATRAQRSNGR